MAALSTIATRSDYNQGTTDGITGAVENEAPQTYECACGKTFKRRAPYERHCEIAHSSTTTSYKCSRCGKTFGNENTLTMHMSVHESKTAFGQLVTGDTPRTSKHGERNAEKEAANSDKENIGDSESSYSPCSNSESVSDISAQIVEPKPSHSEPEDPFPKQTHVTVSANTEQKDLTPLVTPQGHIVLSNSPDVVMHQGICNRSSEPAQTMPSDIASAHPSLAGRLAASFPTSTAPASLPAVGHPAPLPALSHPDTLPVSIAEPLPKPGPPGVPRDAPVMVPPGSTTIVHTFAPMASHSGMMTSHNPPLTLLNTSVGTSTAMSHNAPMASAHPFSGAGVVPSQPDALFHIRPPSLPSELPQLQSPPPFPQHLSPLPKGIHIKKEIIDDEVTFSEETARMMRGLTQEELAMVENFRDLQDNFRDLEDIDEAQIKREIEESDMTEAEKQVRLTYWLIISIYILNNFELGIFPPKKKPIRNCSKYKKPHGWPCWLNLTISIWYCRVENTVSFGGMQFR